MCKTGCNACGGYWIKEPQSVTLTQIANACSRHEQQFTEQQQNKHENNKNYILKHFDDQHFLRTPNNTKQSHHIYFLIFRCFCPFEMVGCLLQTLSQRCTSLSGCRLWDVRYSLDVIQKKKFSCLCLFSRWWELTGIGGR